MAAPNLLAERAISLAAALTPGESRAAASDLAASGDRQSLDEARQDLVRRIQQRSDDYPATAALSLLNQALSQLGWEDPFPWKQRRKP